MWDRDFSVRFRNENTLLYKRLQEHCGHNVSIVKYGLGIGCYALECNDCNEVIMDTDAYDLEGLK